MDRYVEQCLDFEKCENGSAREQFVHLPAVLGAPCTAASRAQSTQQASVVPANSEGNTTGGANIESSLHYVQIAQQQIAQQQIAQQIA